MSLIPGQIVSTDLSPNASILGTQIADNTIQLRNLTDDTFRVVKTGTLTMPTTTVNTGSARYISGTPGNTTVAHGLGYSPAIIAYANFGGGSLLLPWVTMGSIAAATIVQYIFTVEVDATNIYAVATSWAFGPVNESYGNFPVVYYLLQEKASIT